MRLLKALNGARRNARGDYRPEIISTAATNISAKEECTEEESISIN
jgi:hypothetical protein